MSGLIADAQSSTNEMTQSIHANAVRQVVDSGSAVGNPYLYNGRRFESETGLYYNRARYYNPDQGRFISRDPIGSFGDEMNFGNAYGYVGNSPLSLADPSGLASTIVGHTTISNPSWSARGNSIKQVAVVLPEASGSSSQSGGHYTQMAWAKTRMYSPTICPVDLRSKKIYVGNLPFAQTSDARAGSQQHKIYDYSQGFADDGTALVYKYWWKNKSTGAAAHAEMLNNKYTDNMNHHSRDGAGGVRYIADDIGSGVHIVPEIPPCPTCHVELFAGNGGTAAVGQILRDFSGWTSAHGPANSGNSLYSLHRRVKFGPSSTGFTTSFGIKFIKTTRASASGGYTEGPIIVDDDDD